VVLIAVKTTYKGCCGLANFLLTVSQRTLKVTTEMKLLTVLGLAAMAACDPIVYLIRHGEKPEDDGVGLSEEGLQRAQCLRSVFGAGSVYNVGYIMAQEYKPSKYSASLSNHVEVTDQFCADGKRKRPYDTVVPLANDLGLTVDVSCDRDDNECVTDVVNGYEGEGNILIR
jgi:hypothetical protein